MNVGFHYHVGVVTADGVAAPAHMAMFVEELARQAGSVTYFAHSGTASDFDDTILSPPLVRAVDIGPKRSAPARVLRRSIRGLDPETVDVMLVRAPTPLLPAMMQSARRAAVLLVGDYEQERPDRSQPRWRRTMVGVWVKVYGRRQRRCLRRRLVMANSSTLAARASEWGAMVREVFTSSLSARDLEALPSTTRRRRSDRTHLLYAGRICEEKGLLEAVDAVACLSARGLDVVLDIVGFADDERFIEQLQMRAHERGVSERVVYRGYVPAGPELLGAYAAADVFLMPSLNDAFPRSLVEALAVGTPAVATRVGSVPDRLVDGETALLVDPGSPDALADAVERMVTSEELRASLRQRGRRWARRFTNEQSCELIVAELRRIVSQP